MLEFPTRPRLNVTSAEEMTLVLSKYVADIARAISAARDASPSGWMDDEATISWFNRVANGHILELQSMDAEKVGRMFVYEGSVRDAASLQAYAEPVVEYLHRFGRVVHSFAATIGPSAAAKVKDQLLHDEMDFLAQIARYLRDVHTAAKAPGKSAIVQATIKLEMQPSLDAAMEFVKEHPEFAVGGTSPARRSRQRRRATYYIGGKGFFLPAFPGSPKALRRGCICDPVTNNNGDGLPRSPRGFRWMKFDVEPGCPIHAISSNGMLITN